MDFSLTEEQQMIIAATREFVQQELYPHEQTIERTGVLPEELLHTLKAKAIAAGCKAGDLKICQ